jgi:GNAT superfamily N-acetyltransferase
MRSATIRTASRGMMSNQAVESATTVQLLDGRLVSLRGLGAGDAEAVATLHQNLTDHDRYLRFFTLHPVHLDQLVSKLTEPANGEYALGAFDAERLIGVANYAVCDDASDAEIAVVVAHEDHLCGAGTALLKRLAQIARTHGVRRFVVDVMAENHLMLKVLSDCGWPCRRLSYGSVGRLGVELPGGPPEAPINADDVRERGVRNV